MSGRMLWDPFLYCINDSIQGKSETGTKVFVLTSKVSINNISRIENGTRNPSLSMVKKLAHGLGMQLKLEFVPMPTKNKM